MTDTPLDLLARELGAITGRMERESRLRLATMESELGNKVAELESRIADAETRADIMPPELAAEVARAVRMLHEAPLSVDQSATSSRIIRIERDPDGNLLPVYAEP